MTHASTSAGTESRRGSITLVSLPPKVDLPESGILTGIRAVEDLATLNLLTVLYDTSPDEWVQAVLSDREEHPANLGIVTAGDRYRSTTTRAQSPTSGAGPARHSRDESPSVITPLEDPTDLTDLGTAITKYLDSWADTDNRTVVIFDSISGFLNDVDRTDALQFLHILRHRITSANVVGFFVVHPDLHEAETMSMLRTLFDEVVEYSGPASEVTDTNRDATLLDSLDGTKRLIVDQLTRQQSLSISELAARLAEAGVPEERDNLEVGLYHIHLPKLADMDVVTYDTTTGMVELAVPVEEVRPYLRLAREYHGR